MSWQLKNKRPGAGQVGASTSIASAKGGHQTNAISAHHDSNEDGVRGSTAYQTETQKRAFMRWVNVQLATTNNYVPMTSIERELRDGKRLIGLLEVVSKEPLKPERGNMRIHQMANVNKAVSFLEKRTDEPLGSIGNEDIVDGNVKLTLGLIWIIIYRFQIQQIANTMTEVYPQLLDDTMDGESETGTITATVVKGKKKSTSQQVDAKQALLRWVRLQLEDYSDIIPPILDFNRSWKTGIAFAALIHRHDPSNLPQFYDEVLQTSHETMEQCRKTVTLAFEVALEKMAIHRLLDLSDLLDVETPDERSVMTYVSEYYLVMSKHQQSLPQEKVEELKVFRAEAKKERLQVADEDLEATRRQAEEEEERKRREEQEELERIRLRRLEIEGWSIRAAERAREEEEARKKRKEEEEEKSRQRKIRREQREREMAKLFIKTTNRRGSFLASGSGLTPTTGAPLSPLSPTFSDSGREPEPLDPEVLKSRQEELTRRLEEFLINVDEFSQWIEQQDNNFPETPDSSAPLDDCARDLELFKHAIDRAQEKRIPKGQHMPRLQATREELLDHERPELTQEQVIQVDQAWGALDASWTAFGKKVSEARSAAQELQWIVECLQEMERIVVDVDRFSEQLRAVATKRSQDTLEDRTQASAMDHQDSSLIVMKALLKKYADVLSSLLESSAHTPSDHLISKKSTLSEDRLPELRSNLEVAEHNLENDRLLMAFLSTHALSEAWVVKSAEWLASLEMPKFVSEDVWTASESVREYIARDASQDRNLDRALSEVNELRTRLEEEQGRLTEFKNVEMNRLTLDAQAVITSMEETHDVTAETTTASIHERTQDMEKSLNKVEEQLPKEMDRCAYATHVLDYLFDMRTTLSQLESAYKIVNEWAMNQPADAAVAAVEKVEASYTQLESTFKLQENAQQQPHVWESVQIRHAGLAGLVRDLRSCLNEKQEIVKADRMMREFLDLTQACQSKLREIRTQLHEYPPLTGFIGEDTTPFQEYESLVTRVGQAFGAFEEEMYNLYQEKAAEMTAVSKRPSSKQDPAIVEHKITTVNRLWRDIKALRSDRERDVNTIAECRRVAENLQDLSRNLVDLDSTLARLDITDAGQKETLSEQATLFSQLANEFLLVEQETAFRHISRDPSCIPVLKDVRTRQTSIRQALALLQSGLEVGQQWNLLWGQFSDRVEALQQYLDETEREVLERGIATIDGLADGDEKWKKTEDILQEVEMSNNQTKTSVVEFKKQRMLELSHLKTALHQSVQLESGGLETLDQIRTDQYEKAESDQKRLRAQVRALLVLIDQEAFQLEILGQRLVWSQQLAETKESISGSVSSCQDTVSEYATLLKNFGATKDYSAINARMTETLKQQVDHISSLADLQKDATLDVTLAIYESLASLALVQSPQEKALVKQKQQNQQQQQSQHQGSEDSDNSNDVLEPKKVPLHLEVELYEFKNGFSILDEHLTYLGQVADHSHQLSQFLRKVDVMDSGFVRMAVELKAEKEANPITLDKLNAIRVELEDLTKEVKEVAKLPRASDKIADAYTSTPVKIQMMSLNRTDLEKTLYDRLEKSRELSRALDPLLRDFMALLAYQNGLRALMGELQGHDAWIRNVAQKIRSVQDQIVEMFSSWPGNELEQLKSGSIIDIYRPHHGGMVIFDVDEQVMVDDPKVLMVELSEQLAYIQGQEVKYSESERRIRKSVISATGHSKALTHELDIQTEKIEDRIQSLKTDIRMQTLHLEALERRATWEVEIEVARSWFKDFAKAVILFAREQKQWKSNHRPRPSQSSNGDDAVSIRSFRTTASRMQVDKLGLSVIEFEDQVEIFETESRPRVTKAWTELCVALSQITRPVPTEFERRQTALEREFDEIRKHVAYSAQIVTQRRSLEDVAFRLEELDGYKEELRSSGASIRSGKYRNDTIAKIAATGRTLVKGEKGSSKDPNAKPKKEKGWSRFQAKVKKLTKK